MTLLENQSIAQLTTFKIGGKAKYLFQPETTDDIIVALRLIKEKDIPYFILGEGSNVLVGSSDYPGGVISTLRLNKILSEPKQITVQSG
ncbi:MAG: FAD-binding protein, partial [Spirochaetota bacterium]|nr:FAD-binding protein [Spirochaetota bacterium]